MTTKLWGGRFTETTNSQVETFTASIPFDYQLAQEDILGSLAHVKMLGKCGIISQTDAETITAGLKKVANKIENGKADFNIADEDIHMNIERLLKAEIGEVAGKLHTARSRNDQVALDIHLYLRTQVLKIISQLIQFQEVLVTQAKKYLGVIMPGYTHLQRAQPILFSHHLLAYCAMLQRDIDRLQNSWPRINQMPLGAGALAGTGFPIDRQYVAELLAFDSVYQNSMDAVSDRDFIIEFLSHAALIMMHLSRLSEELILWSSQEFGFIELADAYCTGSSIMPQKKNPDVPELVRGKTGRVYGALFNLLTILKGLPLAYNKDLQEDKEPLFDTVKTLQSVLAIYPELINSMQIRPERMLAATQAGFMNATDLADYLVAKGLPFRDAHAVAGRLVQHCIEQNLQLQHLTITQLKQFSPLFADDVYQTLDMETVVNKRQSQGGTSINSVQQQSHLIETSLHNIKDWLVQKREDLSKLEP